MEVLGIDSQALSFAAGLGATIRQLDAPATCRLSPRPLWMPGKCAAQPLVRRGTGGAQPAQIFLRSTWLRGGRPVPAL